MISPLTGIDGLSNCKGELMETKMGVWIDYRKAVIVDLAEEGLQTWTLLSGVDRQPPRKGDSPLTGRRHQTKRVAANDSRQAALTGELNSYYYKIILSMRNACAIFICGPGEAKDELQNIIEQGRLSGRIHGIETVDRMTDGQIAARIAGYFQTVDQGAIARVDLRSPSYARICADLAG
jgi:hypothetical protein